MALATGTGGRSATPSGNGGYLKYPFLHRIDFAGPAGPLPLLPRGQIWGKGMMDNSRSSRRNRLFAYQSHYNLNLASSWNDPITPQLIDFVNFIRICLRALWYDKSNSISNLTGNFHE